MSNLYSIVLLSFQSKNRLPHAAERICAVMEAENIPFELIIVDDGSKDASFRIAKKLASADSRIRAYRLSRNYSTPYAFFAGLSLAKGACATSLPDDLQRSPELAVRMYRKWAEGHKIVVAHRLSRQDGRFNDWFSNLYYALMNRFSDVQFPPGGSDAFLADREVIDILTTRISPIHTTPVVEALRLGFDPVFIGYDRPATEGRSRWTLRKKFRLFADTFFGASVWPLRAITMLGFGVFTVCLFVVLLIIWAKLFTDNTLFGLPVQGWATTLVFMTMFNGLILLCIGVVAEYIWRIFEEVKKRPGFIIRNDDES
jgi:glycosyltransferase involved in cell wall biosynthesis